MAQNISKKFSFIGENIKKIRQVKRISQADFAGLFSLARPSIGAYEEGRSEPKVETIIQIARHFNISIDVLLTRQLTVSEIYSLDLLNDRLNEAHKIKPSNLMKPESGIELVKMEHYLDYIVNHEKADFIRSLPKLSFPDASDHCRAFELQGSEMEFRNQGLHHSDILVGKRVDLKKPAKHKGSLLTVIHTQSITTRRLASYTAERLSLSADDPNYPVLEISMEEIKEVWRIKAVYSTYLQAPSLVEERLMILEKQVAELLSKVSD